MMQANLRAGETLLVHACGSGVGTAAIQLGRALGATVVGTARSEAKLERCKELGMDVGVVAEKASFAAKVPPPAVILELIGGDYLAEDLRCIQLRGRIVVIGLLAGGKTEVDLGLILRKRVQVIGTVLRARPLEEKIAAMRVFEAQVVPLIARAAVKAVIDRVYPLAEVGAAHVRMASNEGFGKIVLRC
jgi:NADPH:quinone reductase-like Zn-dependent oxidoreductase